MSVDLKKHTSIAAGEKPTRAGLAAAILSINDIVPVANATEANQVASALVSAGVSLASTPLAVRRADAPGLHTVEVTKDGSSWAPASGILHFATVAAQTSWTTSYSAQLTQGDASWVGNAQYLWSGSAWVPVGRQSFTPTWTNFTVGASTVTATYKVTEGWLFGFVKIVLGTGFSLTADPKFDAPVAMALPSDGAALGLASMLRQGTGYYSGALLSDSTGKVALKAMGGNTFFSSVSNTAPAAWAAGDIFTLSFNYAV